MMDANETRDRQGSEPATEIAILVLAALPFFVLPPAIAFIARLDVANMPLAFIGILLWLGVPLLGVGHLSVRSRKVAATQATLLCCGASLMILCLLKTAY